MSVVPVPYCGSTVFTCIGYFPPVHGHFGLVCHCTVIFCKVEANRTETYYFKWMKTTALAIQLQLTHGYFRGYAVGFNPMIYLIIAVCFISVSAGAFDVF